jgi:hypothetical protein
LTVFAGLATFIAIYSLVVGMAVMALGLLMFV